MKSPLSPELRWLLRQARPYWPLYFTQFGFVFLSSLVGLLQPLIIKWIIDDIIPWRQGDMLVIAALAFFLAFVFQFGFSGLGFMLDAYTNERLLLSIRMRLVRHVQRLSPAFFDRMGRGQVLHRLESDVDQIRELGGSKVAALVRMFFMTLMTLVIMAILSWKLTLILLPLIPLMLVLRQIGYPRLRQASEDAQKAGAERMSLLQEQLQGMAEIQLLNAGAKERRRFFGAARDTLTALVRRRVTEQGLQFSTDMGTIAGTAFVLGFGGFQVFAGTMTLGGLIAFQTYLSRVFGPTQMLVVLYSSLQRASISIRRVRDVLDSEPEIVEAPGALPLAGSGPLRVEARGLRFHYREETPVLRGLDLDLRPGEKVALVGESGCGKSTLGRLILRLAEIEEGNLLLDGVDVRQFRLRELRSSVAVVSQEPLLFGVSLKENLRYGKPEATEGEMKRVLRIARLEEVVRELPEGWDSSVGAQGSRLSGGQRQRVAIARALLQEPRLLILDEATSALDGVTEDEVLSGVEEALEGRCTILVIAHRLSAIQWADRVVVMEKGVVLDQGDHHQLYARCPYYRALCDRQRKERAGWGESPTVIPEAAAR